MARRVDITLTPETLPNIAGASDATVELAKGSMVDHFQVLRLLGHGAMGHVYLARDTKLGRRVALKLVQPALVGAPEAVERFAFEARTTARFSHPNIVGIFAVGEHHGQPYVALEYIEGRSLRESIEERLPRPTEAARIVMAIAEALAEAHRHGILHRDLKPENVLIGTDGRVRVVDFGLATKVESPSAAHDDDGPISGTLASSGALKGTPAYMAPEQWQSLPSTPATDVWALGALMYEMCTGSLPFERQSAFELANAVCSREPAPLLEQPPDAPPGLSELVAMCLSKDPAGRPASSEVADRLRAALAVGPRAPGDADPSPFRGLLPFTESHAAFYFGRERDVEAFLERCRLEPLLPVVGPSGAGKTSFVRAGVIPRLHEQDRWCVLSMRPGVRPLHSLATRLVLGTLDAPSVSLDPLRSTSARAGLDSIPPPGVAGVHEAESLAVMLRTAPSQLAVALRGIAAAHSARVLLFVDQLEELFTLTDDDDVRNAFMDAIFAAADDPLDPVRVVFTVRDDFLGRLATGPGARAALTHVFVLERPTVEVLERMLIEPARAAGFRFEDEGLAREMASSVADEPAGLPLLQFAAHKLWEQRDIEEKLLLRGAYQRMGGVEGALATHADGVLDGLSAQQVGIARQILLRMVTPERTRKVVTRLEVLSGLGEEGDAVLAQLTRARLLAVRKARGEPDALAKLELAHESLTVRWHSLARWIDEGREDLIFIEEVSQAATRWSKRHHNVDALWHGEQLRDALRMLARVGEQVPDPAKQFLEAAKLREARRGRRVRLLVAVVVIVLATASAVLAIQKRQLADQTRESEARRAEAQLQRAEALTEGARAAFREGNMLEARAKLRAAFEGRDSAAARALVWQLARQPLVWHHMVSAAARAVAISPKGELVAAGCDDGSLQLIDTTTGTARAVREHKDQVQALVFSPDGESIATGSVDGAIVLWSASQQRMVAALEREGSGVLALDYLPDGGLVSGHRDGRLRIHDAYPNKKAARLLGEPGPPVRAVTVRPGGGVVVSGHDDGAVRIFTLADGASKKLDTRHPTVDAARFSPDGRWLATGGRDDRVRLWRTEDWTLALTIDGHGGDVMGLAFSPDGRLLASSSFDRTVRLWRVDDGTSAGVLDGHASGVFSVGFGPDGSTIASAGYDREIRLWNVALAAGTRPERGHGDRVTTVAFRPDDAVVVSGGTDGTLRTWDAKSGEQIRVLVGHSEEIWAASFSPDGALLVSASSDDSIRLWNAATGTPLRVLTGHVEDVNDVRFSPDGRTLASGGIDRVVRIWDVATGATLRTLVGHRGSVIKLAFDPSGSYLASGGGESLVRIWDLRTGRELEPIVHRDRVRDVQFVASGLLVSASDDKTALLSSIDGTTRARLEHDTRVHSADAHGHDMVVTGGADGVVRVWGLGDDGATEPRALFGHRGIVFGVRSSADGQRIASASADGTVRLWERTTGRALWRAPLMAGSPAQILSHRGWHGFERDAATAVAPLGKRAEAAVLERAISAEVSERILCMVGQTSSLELWDRAEDRPLQAIGASPLSEVRALDGACAALDGAHLVILSATGERRSVGDAEVRALGGQAPDREGELLAVTHGELWTVSSRGDVLERFPIRPGAAAVVRRDADSFVAAFRDGTIDVVERTPAADGKLSAWLEHAPASVPTSLVLGPFGTAAVGFLNGTLGLWDLADGKRLAHTRLHGPVMHLRVEGDALLAATDLGDLERWDLSWFSRERCELLRELWQRTPVLWSGGRVIHAPPPKLHPCST